MAERKGRVSMTGPACHARSAVRVGCAIGCSCGAIPMTRMQIAIGWRMARQGQRWRSWYGCATCGGRSSGCPLGRFAQVKGEVGMDQYEVRTWTAWHRFITLCLVAHALLVVLRAQTRVDAAGDGKKGMVNRG